MKLSKLITLDEAIEVLNRRKHNHYGYWWLSVVGIGMVEARGISVDESLSEFEAIAVAEKYLRMEQEESSTS